MNKKSRAKKLHKLLYGNQKPQNMDKLLRYDLLTVLAKQEALNKEALKQKYLSHPQIQTSLIKIYGDVLNENKQRQTFGPGTFVGLQGKLNCIILTKYVIENKLEWSLAEVVQKISYKTLYKYKLRCTKSCFNHIYDLIMACYLEADLKPYYFKKASHVWVDEEGNKNKELIKQAIREFVSVLTDPKGNHKHKLKNIPRWINYKMFRKSILPYNTNLSYMLSKCFGNSHIKAIMFAYPELNLKPYYFANVPNNYWSGEEGMKHAKEVMKELMTILTDPKGKYKLSREEVKDIFKFKTYEKPLLPYRKNMRGMLQTLFNNSPTEPFKLLEDE